LQIAYPESMSRYSLSYGSDTTLNKWKSVMLSIIMMVIIIGSFVYVMLYGVINLIHDFTDIEKSYTIYNVSLSSIDCTEVTPLKSLCSVMANSDSFSLDKIYIPESISDDLTDGDFQLRTKDTLVGKSVVGYRQQ